MRRMLLVVVIVIAVAALMAVVLARRSSEPSFDLGNLPGAAELRPAEYAAVRKITTRVRRPDGVHLAVDAFVPEEPLDGAAADERFPTIFSYTPYGRSVALTDLSWLDRLGLWFQRGLTRPMLDASAKPGVKALLARGYAYVSADMRGSGASGGSVMQLDPRHGPDGAALIDWITDQPWSDGQVCMHGQSYVGWSQFAVAAEQPEGLRCIAPSQIFFESYTGSTRPGGVTAIRWLQRYSDYLQGFTDNDRSRGYATAPAIDEDGDGALIDEIPLDPAVVEPRRYADNQDRSEQYYARATAEHAHNLQPVRMADEQYRFSDSILAFQGRQYSYAEISPGVMLARAIRDSDIAVLNIVGWFDGFAKGGFTTYATLAGYRPNRLFVAPRFHIPLEITPAYRELFDYAGSYADQLTFEELRFFDTNLKGLDNGWTAEPPVKLYVMNSGWRQFRMWPPADATSTPFHLSSDGMLSRATVAESTMDSLEVDWLSASNYGANGSNRWLLMTAPDDLMLRNKLDESALVYQTGALANELTVIGHPIVNLRVSSNQPDADVFVYLSDVAPDGRVHYVSEGRLRLGFAEAISDNDAQALGLIDVKPELPWHGFRRADYNPQALRDGRVVSARFDLFPTAWRFRKGHRIRIAITGADSGNFQLNPSACPAGDPATCPATVLHIHRGGTDGSVLELPVLQ